MQKTAIAWLQNRCVALRRLLQLSIIVLNVYLCALDPAYASPDGGPSIRERDYPGLQIAAGVWALATFDNIGPVILYDPVVTHQITLQFGPAGFRWLQAHEYAHHRRNHLSSIPFINPFNVSWIRSSTELVADCWAARVLSRNGDEAAIRAGIAMYQMSLFPFSAPGIPGSAQRVQNIVRCAGW